MYNSEDIPDLRPSELPNKPMFYQLIREYRNLTELDQKELKRITAVYMGMITYVDHLLGEILDALEEYGLWDNTALFAFSDHGDWAGDYGLVEKWPCGMDDTLTRVPMIVRVPNEKGGHIVETPIECFDIVPTTLELAGIKCQHTQFGVSMMPQLQGEPSSPGRAVFCEGGYDTHEPHCFEGYSERDAHILDPNAIYYAKVKQQQDHPKSVARATMIRTAEFKYVKRPSDIDEFYDLKNDPQELNNVISDPAHGPTLMELKDRLIEWYVHTSDVIPYQQDARGFPEKHTLGISQY